MPPLQTSYSENIGVGQAGAPAAPDWDADSRIVETEAGIGFGLAVSRGAGDRGVVIGGAQFVGISLHDVTQPPDNVDEYSEGENIGVMTRGLIYVVAALPVEAGQVVRYNETTGALSDSDGTLIAGATWESSAAQGGIAKLRLTGELPGAAATT